MPPRVKLMICVLISILVYRNMSVLNNIVFDNKFASTPKNNRVTNTEEKKLAECQPENIIGRHLIIDVPSIKSSSDEDITNVEPGGRYSPPDCVAKHRVAIIIPFRNRTATLKILLRYLHPYLQRRKIYYRVFLVEQTEVGRFNKAVMMNTGFVEASKVNNFTCFIFHDADLLPETDGVPYTCEPSPLHLAVAVDELNYKLKYPKLFGGVTGFTQEHFRKVNGFSNLYFGWGAEDDEMYERVVNSGLKINRLPMGIGRYKMLKHVKEKENSYNYNVLRSVKTRQASDGLNSVKSHVVKYELKPLYTWILVSINETEITGSVFKS